MKKEQITMKLRLHRETLHTLSGVDLKQAAGGITTDRCSRFCEPTGASDCYECGSVVSGGSCPTGFQCC